MTAATGPPACAPMRTKPIAEWRGWVRAVAPVARGCTATARCVWRLPGPIGSDYNEAK